MSFLDQLPMSSKVTAPPDSASVARLAEHLDRASGLIAYPASIVTRKQCLYFLSRHGTDKFICVALAGEPSGPWARLADRKAALDDEGSSVLICPANFEATAQLACELDFLKPRPLGLAPSFGFGDRLGLATPGHVRALVGSKLVPFFPQQSMREMTRTVRTPEDVMTDALLGVFQEGYRDGFGADADHLKTTDDADVCIRAGFTLFTVDPGEHVDDAADTDAPEVLARKFEKLPWDRLESSATDCRTTFLGKRLTLLESTSVDFPEEVLLRAGVKYGRAIAHTVAMYRHIAGKLSGGAFELEVSVDETANATSVAEHFYVATELKRLGVKWVSLAPRFVGAFEKGVDYIGDLSAFERTFAGHVAVARHVGPYKLSLHSGSDKFSIYPVVAKLAGELVHVKTAGTSYLEALRVVAQVEPELFREILEFGHERYETDKATYHVSADARRVPHGNALADDDLTGLLDAFDARQMLHVTYGSVLTARDGEQFRTRLLNVLQNNEELYSETLKTHLSRHLAPFGRKLTSGTVPVYGRRETKP